MSTIGVAINLYNEVNALPGFLESATQWADDIKVIHAGPNGRASTDGTMEILEKWGIKPIMSRIDDGFGVVRTQCIRESRTDWVVILDADERIYPLVPIISCEGNEAYPNTLNPNLKVIRQEPEMFNQLSLLKTLIDHDCMAVRATRRHWFDYTWKRPCQNWCQIPDWQLRIVRNSERVGYLSEKKMHEQCMDSQTGDCPKFATERQGDPRGIFIDHYHCFWKAQEPDQRREDIDIYNALDSNSTALMWSVRGYDR